MKSNELIQRYLLDLASDEEVRELESRLHRDEKLQNEFLLQAELDTHLRQEAETVNGDHWSSQINNDLVASTSSNAGRTRMRFFRWGSVGMAAATLLALFLVLQNGGPHTAMAAVQRSMDAIAELTTRKYSLQVEYQTPIGTTVEIDNDLYVHGNDRFALHHHGLLPGKSFWLGQNGSEYWVVPAEGPVFKGNNTLHSHWLRSLKKDSEQHDASENVDIPDMHVTTLLARMSRGYDLELLDDEEIELSGRGQIACEHVRAKRKLTDRLDRPDTIELWASHETGMPVRLYAQWNVASDQVGRKSVVLTFKSDAPSLSDDWFTAEGHYEGDRPIRRMESSEK